MHFSYSCIVLTPNYCSLPMFNRSDRWMTEGAPTSTYFYIYLAVSLSCIVFSFLTGVTFFQSMLVASKTLHTDLFQVCLHFDL